MIVSKEKVAEIFKNECISLPEHVIASVAIAVSNAALEGLAQCHKPYGAVIVGHPDDKVYQILGAGTQLSPGVSPVYLHPSQPKPEFLRALIKQFASFYMALPSSDNAYLNLDKAIELFIKNNIAEELVHPDNTAVDTFAKAMKDKMHRSRLKGRSGWDVPAQCSTAELARLFVGHLNKDNEGNFIDLANLLMMLHLRNARPDEITLATARRAFNVDDHTASQNMQADAWHAICNLLNEIKPDWMDANKRGIDAAIETLRGRITPQGLTFSALREANLKRVGQFKNGKGGLAHSEPDGSDWSPAQWFQAAAGELGDYANKRKKFERGDITEDEFKKHAAYELADTLIYLDLLAYHIGVDLAEAVKTKFNIVSRAINSDVTLG